MTFSVLVGAMTLSAFAVVIAAGSAVVAWGAPAIGRRYHGCSPAACAAGLFRLRMMPGVLAAIAAFAIVLPTFLEFEPRDTQESLPGTVILLACVGGVLLLRGGLRAAHAWRATRRVLREWRIRGRRLEGFDTPLPVFAIEEAFPTVAVVGVVRPALFIAERVLRECPEHEIRAMLHHECAHVTERDNLKRLLMRACPDFLGAELDRAWARAAEEAADAAVVEQHPGFALELAQALIRVARLTPAPEAPALASAFYLGGSIESRVRRLVQPVPVPTSSPAFGHSVLAAVALVAAAVVLAAAPALYRVLEAAVHFVP